MAVRLQFAAKDAPNPIDQHVGRRVRMRRKVLAISQQKLGAALGLLSMGGYFLKLEL